jgi:ribosomal protein S4
MRLDNIVFRLNMAPTIAAARQLISHGHIQVNQKRVNIASYMCKPKDVISVSMKPKSLKLVYRNLQEYTEQVRFHKNRLQKTLAFLLFQSKIMPTLTAALKAIQQGTVFVNNRKVTMPNYICTNKDVVSISTEKGMRKVKFTEV